MRTLLLLLLISSAAHSQTIAFPKASYLFYDTVVRNNTWWRELTQNMTATMDTVGKKIVVPNLQLWANTTSRRNLITGQSTTTGDTTLSASGTMTIKIVGNPLHYRLNGGYHVIWLNLQDGLYAIWVGNYLAITYPKFNGFIRLVEFGELQ